MTFKTADLYDQHGEALRVCEPIFGDFGGLTRFAGPAATVKCFEDNTQVKAALAEPGAGRVLVVDAGGSLRCAMLGDLIAASAVDNGWAGVLITAACATPGKSPTWTWGSRHWPPTRARASAAARDSATCR